MKRLNLLFMILGLILIIDGILSIAFQISEDLMYQEVRIARCILGLMVIHVPYHERLNHEGFKLIKKIFRYDCLLIGIIIICDSIISIFLQFQEPFIFQIGRYVRLGIGIFLAFINLYLVKKKNFLSI